MFKHLVALGCQVVQLPRPVDRLTAPIPCDVVVHCSGRLRGASCGVLWRDNVAATDMVLKRLRPGTPVVLASSRAALSDSDDYAETKRLAERLVQSAGPHLVVRLTVLAGPSGRRVGSSFLSRMVGDLLTGRPLRVIGPDRVVDLLDVREAAETLARLAVLGNVTAGAIDATSGPRPLDQIADEISAEGVRRGIRDVVIESVAADESVGLRIPAAADGWRALQQAVGAREIPLRCTVIDTFDAIAASSHHS